MLHKVDSLGYHFSQILINKGIKKVERWFALLQGVLVDSLSQ